MNAHQQEIIKQKIQKDSMFMQAYMQDVNNCRNLRTQAMQAAMAMQPRKFNAATGKVTELPDAEIDKVLADAQKIYMFYTQDGKFEDLAAEAKVQLS